MRQNTKISAAHSLVQHERQQAKLQWLQDPSQMNAHNVNNTSAKQVNISGTEKTSDR
jgi:hypothetical protein